MWKTGVAMISSGTINLTSKSIGSEEEETSRNDGGTFSPPSLPNNESLDYVSVINENENEFKIKPKLQFVNVDRKDSSQIFPTTTKHKLNQSNGIQTRTEIDQTKLINVINKARFENDETVSYIKNRVVKPK